MSVAEDITPENSASSAVLALAEQIQTRFRFYARDKPQAQCVLLLDPALRDAAVAPDFAAYLNALQPPVTAGEAERILWHHHNLSAHHRPYLIPLDLSTPAAQGLLHEILRLALEDQALESLIQGLGQRICGWLFTAAPLRLLATHLGHVAVQRLPLDYPRLAGKRLIGGKGILLRYYDPCVMPYLWALSNAAQRKTMLGPVAQWQMLGQNQQLQFYAPAADAIAALAVPGSLSTPLHYSNQQWQAIQSIGGLNQATFQWQAQSVDGQVPTKQQLQDSLRALVRAQGYGIDGAKDLQAFAWHALTVHPLFDEHPMIQQALKNLPLDEYYTASIADISEQDWQRIQHELSTGTQRHPFDPNTTSANP